jgi:hypothetical protein
VYANSSWFVRPRLRQKQLVADGLYPKPPKPSVAGLFRVLTFVPNCILSFTSAFNFSGLSAMYIVFPRVCQTRYGWDGSETGYAYLAPGTSPMMRQELKRTNFNRCGFDCRLLCGRAYWGRHLPAVQDKAQRRKPSAREAFGHASVCVCRHCFWQDHVWMVRHEALPSSRRLDCRSTRYVSTVILSYLLTN